MSAKTTDIEQADGRKLRRWDPFGLLEEMQEEMARLWGEAWPRATGPLALPFRRSWLGRVSWTPRIDVFEKGGKLVIQAELPGVDKKDIEVTIVDGDLVIQGERRAEKEVREEDYVRIERTHGSFYRRIPLPFDVDVDKIEARFADGVLEIQIPQPAEEPRTARKIAVF